MNEDKVAKDILKLSHLDNTPFSSQGMKGWMHVLSEKLAINKSEQADFQKKIDEFIKEYEKIFGDAVEVKSYRTEYGLYVAKGKGATDGVFSEKLSKDSKPQIVSSLKIDGNKVDKILEQS